MKEKEGEESEEEVLVRVLVHGTGVQPNPRRFPVAPDYRYVLREGETVGVLPTVHGRHWCCALCFYNTLQ